MKIVIKVTLMFCVLVLPAACTTSNPYRTDAISNEAIVLESYWSEFEEGKLKMTQGGWVSGYSSATKAALALERIEYLKEAKDWPALVKNIFDHNFGDNVNWYLLGIAARELGYTEAAMIYFRNSISESSRKLRGACIGSTCLGYTFPKDAEAALKELEREKADDSN
jgi:hypothetical protein